jgi:TonB family protein
MSYTRRLAICVAASVAAHILLARGSAHLPARVETAPAVVLRVALRQTPAPEPEPEPASTSPEHTEPKPAHAAPVRRSHKPSDQAPAKAPEHAVPSERPATTDTGATPVFGISMESTSSAGEGPSMRVGNTLRVQPQDHPGASHAAPPRPVPVPAYEVSKMPLPQGECGGKYTEEARQAGLEGVVVFDVVVDEHGRVRDLTAVQGLGGGLTEAARLALQACSFSPGERDGKPVAVRIRSYKVRFRLRENE